MALDVSEKGLALLKRLEGFRGAPMTLPDGRLLVGYGHVQASPPPAPLTEDEAEKLLRQDLAPIARTLNDLILAPVSQSQFDALASFAFSIGLPAFAKSDVLRRLNAGEPIAAACAMDAWRKSRIAGEPAVLDALVRRRTAEKSVFLELGEWAPAASALVGAEIDHAAAILGQPTAVCTTPREAPAAVSDHSARKIARILASEPGTAHALAPPPAPLEDEIDESDGVLILRERAEEPQHNASEVMGYALFGTTGVALLAAGFIAQSQKHPVLFLLFAAPGAVMLGGALWRLLREKLGQRPI